MTNVITLDKDIELQPGEVLLTVTIGDEQIGGSMVEVDFETVTRGTDIESFRIGEYDTLKGKELIVSTLVKDVSKKTNRASVTYTISSGSESDTFGLNHNSTSHGALTEFRATFRLK